jgi:hypothetical protein
VTWLVTGGAGYIGAHVVAAMRAAEEPVVVLDDLSTGDPDRIPGTPLVVGSVLDGDLVAQTLREQGVTGVVHIAAKKRVEESVRCRCCTTAKMSRACGYCSSTPSRPASARWFSPRARRSTACRTLTSSARTPSAGQ